MLFLLSLHMENPFSSDIILSFSVFFLSCAAGDFRHGCAGAGDEVYRSPDPGETDLPSPTELQPALRPEQPPHQHIPLRPQRPKGTDVRGVIHFPILITHAFKLIINHLPSFPFLIVSINCHH